MGDNSYYPIKCDIFLYIIPYNTVILNQNPKNFIISKTIVFSLFKKHDLPHPDPRGGGGGGSDTLIFSHIRRLGPFFLVQNSEFQYFFGFSEKRIFFGVFRFCGYFFGVITKLA